MKFAYAHPEQHGGRIEKSPNGFSVYALGIQHPITFPAPPTLISSRMSCQMQ